MDCEQRQFFLAPAIEASMGAVVRYVSCIGRRNGYPKKLEQKGRLRQSSGRYYGKPSSTSSVFDCEKSLTTRF